MTHYLPPETITRAVLLIGAVHEEGPQEVAALLTPLDTADLYALTVTLAALVPADYSPGELLAWNDTVEVRQPGTRPDYESRTVSPHGTHSAFNRHRAHGEEPCDECWYGERRYQRDRQQRRRRERKLRPLLDARVVPLPIPGQAGTVEEEVGVA